ncbi:MAG: hypothetical protein ACOYBV_01190 [Candidatus Avilachnospira sp.]|jgi:hypothetical protein
MNTKSLKISEKKSASVVDMTEGSTMRHIINFALPMFLGYLF